MFKFILSLLPVGQTYKERRIIKRFWKDPNRYVGELITFIEQSPRYTSLGRYYSSCSGMINVCDDIYGYEVKIRPCDELLDCCPSAYGLHKLDALKVYEAILSRVPGSSSFKFTPPKL